MERHSDEESEEMKYYRKRYKLKRLQIRIPRLDKETIKKARVNCDVLLRASSENNYSEIVSSRFRTVNVSERHPVNDNVERSSTPSLRMEESGTEKIPDDDDDFHTRGQDIISMPIHLAGIQTEERTDENYVPGITVDDEIVACQIHEETEEKFEMGSRETDRCVPNINETKSRVRLEAGCNSISTFIEREEEDDQIYFHVLRVETTKAENEVCLTGVFVKEV